MGLAATLLCKNSIVRLFTAYAKDGPISAFPGARYHQARLCNVDRADRTVSSRCALLQVFVLLLFLELLSTKDSNA